jgi:hypothetical protein
VSPFGFRYEEKCRRDECGASVPCYEIRFFYFSINADGRCIPCTFIGVRSGVERGRFPLCGEEGNDLYVLVWKREVRQLHIIEEVEYNNFK